ncbi:MAG: sucrose phosphorylase [Fulvivirga sp.]
MNNKVQLISYPDRFGRNGIAGLHHILNKHLKGVIHGVHLLPFFNSIKGLDAGYDPKNHTEVDPSIGDWADVTNLSQDYDLMADIIVNHISAESKEFKDVLLRGRESDYFNLFLTKDKIFHQDEVVDDMLKIYRPQPGLPFITLTTENGEAIDFWSTFTENQIDIDVNSKQGLDYLNSILESFKSAGIKMIRLDAAGFVIKKAGTTCFLLDETLDFIERFSQRAKTLGIETLVEIRSNYSNQIKIASKVDYVYDFALPFLVLNCLRSRNFDALKRWLTISPRNCVTVLDTHDGIGVADVAEDGENPGLLSNAEIEATVSSIHENSNGQSLKASGSAALNVDSSQINCTFYDAVGRSDQQYLIARAIQLFCPGIPQIYYVGLLAGTNDTSLLEETNEGRDINRHYYTEEEIALNLERQIVRDIIQLIRFRNEHPSFLGVFSIQNTTSDVLHLRWDFENQWSDIKIHLTTMELSIEYTEGTSIQHINFAELQNN